MWPNLSTTAAIMLGQSHSIAARVTVTSPNGGAYVDLPISAGEVDIDTTSQVRTKATFTADMDFWPATPLDLLAPFGSRAFIEYGIGLPAGLIEWVPCGVFVLDQSQRQRPVSTSQTGVAVQLNDLSALVADDRFEAPTQTVAGATCVAEITRLIQEVLGIDVAVIDLTGSTLVAAQIEMQRDRWAEGIEALADAIGAEVFFDRLGQPTIRPVPTLADTAVWTVTTGPTDSILISQTDTLSRDAVYNAVVASGQRSDGTAPVYSVVTDDDPTSPTFYGGPFGKKPRFYSSALLTTVDDCTVAGIALLERARGTGAQVALETLVNPAIDGGDVLTLVQDGTLTTHIVDQASIPLGPDGTQKLGTRSVDLLPAES
jgi:hypothetical protein